MIIEGTIDSPKAKAIVFYEDSTEKAVTYIGKTGMRILYIDMQNHDLA